MVVGIADDKREPRSLIANYGESCSIGGIRNRAGVDDVRHNPAVHEAVDSVAAREIEFEVIQCIDFASEDDALIRQRLRDNEFGDAGGIFSRLGKRHVEIGECQHAGVWVDVFSVSRFGVNGNEKAITKPRFVAIDIQVVVELASVLKHLFLSTAGDALKELSQIRVQRDAPIGPSILRREPVACEIEPLVERIAISGWQSGVGIVRDVPGDLIALGRDGIFVRGEQ